jgi:hypothetical protein
LASSAKNPSPPPDGQSEQIIEVVLGTSARIGEVLAIRKCDVNVTASLATIRICGSRSPAGKPTYRQPHRSEKKRQGRAGSGLCGRGDPPAHDVVGPECASMVGCPP